MRCRSGPSSINEALKVLIGSLIPLVLVFSLWDIVAIARDHWTYNPKYVTGIHLGDLPLEEVVFFAKNSSTVPTAS